jgi:diamine N-acetyltransferase
MLTDGLVIRRAAAADAATLAEFGAAAFRDTFGAENTPEDIEAYLAATYHERRQQAEIASADTVTLIVEQEGSLIAFAQVRRGAAPSCVALPQPVEIWRFYVAREWHGTGLAHVLMRAALDAAAELGGASVWLSVWERNPRGIRFYAKCGFADVGSKVFVVGSDRQTDRVMARAVAPR